METVSGFRAEKMEMGRWGRNWRFGDWNRGARGFRSGPLVIGVLESVEAFIGDVDQLVGLVTILGKCGDTVVHRDGESQLDRAESFREDRFDTPAQGDGLSGIGLREQHGKFVPTNAESGVRSA